LVPQSDGMTLRGRFLAGNTALLSAHEKSAP